MNMTEIFYVAGAVLASTGGAAAIIFGLSSWLGRVWANRILENDKLFYSSELEKLKNKLDTNSQQQQFIFSLYFESQFKLYNELWNALIELQDYVDALWSHANQSNLRQFFRALASAKKQIQKNALSIEPEHYSEIMNAIDSFNGYHTGKEQLINKRSIHEIGASEIEALIQSNKNSRDQINSFIKKMHSKMQMQIGGNLAPITREN